MYRIAYNKNKNAFFPVEMPARAPGICRGWSPGTDETDHTIESPVSGNG